MGWMEGREEGSAVGDEPWDIMGEAVDKIIKVYQRVWERNPTLYELQSTFEFVLPEEYMEIVENDNQTQD